MRFECPAVTMMTSHMAATLCVILMLTGQGCTKPTDDTTRTEIISNEPSTNPDSAKQEPLDYVIRVNNAGDESVEFRSATDDEQGDDEDDDVLAEAHEEYERLFKPSYDDYEDYSSSGDEADDDQIEPNPLIRSGGMVLIPSTYQGSGSVSLSSGFPPNQRPQGIGQTLNSAYYTQERQSNTPGTQLQKVISQTLNPAYATQQNIGDSRGQASVARLLYLMGMLSNSAQGVAYGQLGSTTGQSLNSLRQPATSGTLGGLLSYGQSTIRQPALLSAYGSVGGANTAISGASSSGSAYDYLSNYNRPTGLSTGLSNTVSVLGGRAFIEMIRPIARFVAIRQSSPQKHWLNFVKNINEAQISGSGAYETLYKQINYESQRQQRLVDLLKRYKKIATRKASCTNN